MGGDKAWLAESTKLLTIEATCARIDPGMLEAASAHTDGSAPRGSGGHLSELPEALRVAGLLVHMPYVVPFGTRLELLRRWLVTQRDELASQTLAAAAIAGWHNPITVRRDALLTDAFSELRGLGDGWRLPLRVRFFSAEGLEEAGIGEGIAKEFLVDVLREGFDPQTGLFATGTEGALYPNPAAVLHRRDAASWFEFLGAVLAKTLYEGILVELPFAPFFLNLLLGRTNTVHDMPAYDAQVARSLDFLKSYDGDVEDLCLTFAIEQFSGDVVPQEQRRTVQLVPGGADVRVTAANRAEYILRLAHYRLNSQLRGACDAFLRGFSQVVPREWIGMFSPAELQLVLGGSDAPLSVSDWRAHTVYSGGYHANSPVVQWFWQVVEEFDRRQRAATLKFVTSCSRPPLMGFRWLQPAFCIHKASAEEARLPTSATCMNLLKLPPYESLETLREKLTYAIEAGAGFELS
mmetsp:Transcript_20968/g.57572  ORF Transcript_20968/g.57572 Transcript_20968/m.57572 type:complete len:464 (-) Transcript_20968:476-1867(-)